MGANDLTINKNQSHVTFFFLKKGKNTIKQKIMYIHNVQISFCFGRDPVLYDLPIANWALISASSTACSAK